MAAFKIISSFRNVSVSNTLQIFKFANVCSQKYTSFSSKAVKQFENNSIADKKKKVAPVPKITLIFPDENMQILNMEEAQKLSRRRDLKLVKILDLDTKTQRPLYKLMTGAEFHAEDLKQREARKENKNDSLKGEKLLLLNYRISEHDLESRIKNIIRWINKKYEVRVVVTGDSTNVGVCDHVYNAIAEKLKNEGRILQKRSKGNELKFQIVPLKTSSQKSDGRDGTNL